MDDLPPSYSSLFNEHRSGISYIDFVPLGVKKGFFSKTQFETFRNIIDNANAWLRLNPQWEINTCESIEFKDKDGAIYPTKMSYYENTRYQTKYVRGLRLWLKMFAPGEERVQQIGYVNLIPETVSAAGVFTHAKYETLDDTLMRFNNTSRSSPIPGRIITIETQNMKIKSGDFVDPDRSHWTECGDHNNRFIYIIRIFYEVGDPFYEEIGMTDFIPDVTSAGCCSSKYDEFPDLFNKASRWLSHQTGIKVYNMQSLSSKMYSGYVETRKMSYTEHEGRDLGTQFLKILRIAHTKRQAGANRPVQFSCKTFVPAAVSSSTFGSPQFETLQVVMQRVSNWIQAVNVEVLSLETATVRLSYKGPIHSSNKTLYCDRGNRECYIFIIRAYLKGLYNEPIN